MDVSVTTPKMIMMMLGGMMVLSAPDEVIRPVASFSPYSCSSAL